ncbi:hypothetical protein NDU88_004247 [Pleurodeles waltl]|uniref:Uncharacterized protein n=1 Tax=Pleurodeles waltl TaxID=8319 RepID=A0AAV7QBQ4_PLEWA|nr:hypothetical protein NDU88_004247 [Pleurodeles waltl]
MGVISYWAAFTALNTGQLEFWVVTTIVLQTWSWTDPSLPSGRRRLHEWPKRLRAGSGSEDSSTPCDSNTSRIDIIHF